MHNKLNLYIPNKKINNHSFIISIRNVIENYEIKKEKIIRHDYVTKSLIQYAKSIKKNRYNWLDYATFKNMEKKIIKDENKNMESDNIINIIKAINKMDINEKLENEENLPEKDSSLNNNDEINNVNNSFDNNEIEVLSIESDNNPSDD